MAPKTPTEEEYFKDMKEAKDGFEVNAEFVGRGLFSEPESKKPIQETDSEGRSEWRIIVLDSENIDAIPIQELKISLLCSEQTNDFSSTNTNPSRKWDPNLNLSVSTITARSPGASKTGVSMVWNPLTLRTLPACPAVSTA